MHLVPATLAHAAGWAEVVETSVPHLVVSAASVAHEMGDPTIVHQQVALDGVESGGAEPDGPVPDGAVVGVCRLRRTGDDLRLLLLVHPGHRRIGLGGRLLAAADAAAAAVAPGRRVVVVVDGDEGSLTAARTWGFAPERATRVSGVDPRTVSAPTSWPALPGRVVALSEIGPEAAWDCLVETGSDDPSGLSAPPPYDVFLTTLWQAPAVRADLSRAWVDDERVWGVAVVTVGGQRAFNAFTGTVPDARGHGLARALKQAVLVALAEAGVTVCTTGNDAANAPMLAVNASLGYRPLATSWIATREPRV